VITIPRYEEPQVQSKPLPGARVDAVAPAEAFGGGASAAAAADATKSVAKVAEDIFHQEKVKADDVATQEAYAKTVQLRNKLMYDPQEGAMTKRGKDAFGVMDNYLPQFDKGADDIEKGLGNEDQRAMFRKLRLQQRTDLNDSLQKHTFVESQKYDEDTTKAGIETQREDALLNYQIPGRIDQAIKFQEAIIRSHGERTGQPDEAINLAIFDAKSKTHTAVIQRMLANDDVEKAKAYYDANKGNLGAGEVTAVEKAIEDGSATQRGLAAWNDVRGLRLSNGEPDEAKMQAKIMEDPSLTTKEKEKAWEFVKAKAGEDIRNKSRQEAANDRTFMNSAIKARASGEPMEQALKIAGQYSADAYDKALKEDAVRKIYAPAEIKSDPATKVALLDGIDEGTVTRDQIDLAYQKKLISPSDWVSSRERYHNVVQEGKSPAQQRANEQVQILAKSRFGSDSNGIASFVSDVKSASFGKSPEEMVKIAQDKLKQDEGTVSRFWNWIPVVGGEAIPGSGTPQYQTDQQKRTSESLVKGKLHQDLGVETVKAIELSNIRSGSKASAAESVDAMSVAFGGYDKIKPGTPVYNAMQSLSKRGKAITVDVIKTALEHHPDGNF
jgi:hypothetical protein